jgi:hypothetical protein
MNRRTFLLTPVAAAAAAAPRQSGVASGREAPRAAAPAGAPGVAILLVDTDRVIAPIDRRIYGHFLEHINHSVEDGLFAEQIRGRGFEGEGFATYWKPFSDRGRVELAEVDFRNGNKCVRLQGAKTPMKAAATLHTISAGLRDAASLEHPDALAPVSRSITYATDLAVDLAPYTVAVVEIRAG